MHFFVQGQAAVRLCMTAPGDAAIAHPAALLAAASRGSSTLTGFPVTPDTLRTVDACRALGAIVEVNQRGTGPGGEMHRGATLKITGRDFDFDRPSGVIECGSSACSLLLLPGLLAGQPFQTALSGGLSTLDPALQALEEALSQTGACLRSEVSENTVLLTIEGKRGMKPLRRSIPVESAHIKNPLLLTALQASGISRLQEASRTPDHVENLLGHFGASVVRREDEILVPGGGGLSARDLDIPGDISIAACWMAAAAARPGSELMIRHTGLNVGRCGLIRVLLRMGARITEEVDSVSGGEPSGSLKVRGGGTLRSTFIDIPEFRTIASELPAVALAAALARGKTVISTPPGAVTWRFTALIAMLRAFGVPVRELSPGGLEITGSGGAPLQAARIDSRGDPALAAAAAVAGLLSRGTTLVKNAQGLHALDPGFAHRLHTLQDLTIKPAA